MNKYNPLLLSILLLIPCADTKPMNHIGSTKDKMMLASVVVALLATGYGFFRFLTWLKPLKSEVPRSGNIQSIGNISAKGNVSVKQAGGDNSTQVIGNVVGGNVCIQQTMLEGDSSTQIIGNVVGGSIAINQSGDNNRISGNSITTNGSVVASQGQSAHDSIGSTKTKSMMLVGDQFLKKIIVSGIGQLLISQNTSLQRVEASITAEKRIVDNFSIVKEGNNLVIGPKKNVVIRSQQPVVYKIAMPMIPKLFIKENIAVQFVTGITQDCLRLNLQGNGSIDCGKNCPINAKKIITSAVENSNVCLKGIVPEQRITLRGNAFYNAEETRSSFIKLKGFDNGEVRLLIEDSPGDLYGPVRSKMRGELHGNRKLFYQGSNPINEIVCHDNTAIERINY
jgi:hypothetical protein